MFNLAKHRVGFFFSILFFVAIGTLGAILFTRGYKIDFVTKTLKSTGLLVVSSNPPGAEILINSKLKTATNNSVSLEPGDYEVEVIKIGFLPWKKRLTILKELVTSADIFLFPSVPDLKPLTFEEVFSPVFSPDSTRIAYSIPLNKTSSTSVNAGLWVMDLVEFPFTISREPRLVAKSISGLKDFSQASYSWSPDNRQLLVQFAKGGSYLIDPNQLNDDQALVDVTSNLPEIILSWQKLSEQREKAKFNKLPEELKKLLVLNTENINFSIDGTKIVYTATASAEIPDNLIPPVLAASTQNQLRKLESGKTYVYDIKEDKNFLIPFEAPKPTPTPKPNKKVIPTPTLITDHWPLTSIRWFPTSRHLYWIEGDKIIACEYDGTNLTTIYSGPFIKPFVFAAPSGNRLIILTKIDFEKNTKPNLFEVSLR